MAAMTRIKRGSMQIQRAAIKAGGRIGARNLMMVIVVFGLILSGLVQHSATVALMALSDPLSSADFAEYVANTSYVTRYCAPINNMSQIDVLMALADAETLEVVEEEAEYEESEEILAGNETSHGGHGRHIVAEPHVKVPLLEEESVDSLLREIFLWGTFISPLPSSRLAARIGPKRIIGPALLADGLLLLLVPLAWFTPYHVAIRFVQGVFTGATWPALHMLAASWFPPLQRSGFISCYSAVSVGTALAGLLGTPLVLAAGRDSLCYILASLTSLWFLAWWRFVYDTPGEHPSLPEHKKKHLETAIGNKLTARSATPPLPWRHLLSSAPVWACAVACLGNQWGQTTLQLAVTKYLKLVYGFSLTCDRVLSVLPHIGYFMAALLFGRVVDHVRSQPLVSTTTARKLFVYISHFFPAAMLFVVGYSGCDPSFPAALYTAAVMTSGATPSGSYTSAVDIAPNYAGTIFALSQTFGAAGSLVGNYVITEGLHGSLPGSWRLVFGVASGVLVLTAVFFMSVGSGSVQHWNNLRDRQERQSQGSLATTDSRRSSGPRRSFPGDASGPHAAAIAALLAGRRSSLGDRRGSLQYRSSLEAVKEAEQTELEEFMDDHENLSLYLDHGLSQNSLLRKRTGSTSSRRTVISSETQTILEELTSPEGETDAAVITTVVVTRAQVERGGDQDEPTVEGRPRTEEQTKGGKKGINVQTSQL